MRKILLSLFILLAVNSQAQFVYPTETVWDFLSGLQTNRINSSTSTRLGINVAPLQDFHVLADTVRFEGLDGTGGFLTVDANGVINKGVAALSGLNNMQILFGAADGTVAQSIHFAFDDINDVLAISDADPSIVMTGTSTSSISMEGALVKYTIQSIADGSFNILSNLNGDILRYSNPSQRLSLRSAISSQDFNLAADTLRLEGLDGTGTYLGIDVNGDVTRTTVSAGLPTSSTVGQVLRVTGVNTYNWGAVDLTDGDAVTGALPVSNGGTGITSFASGVATWLGSGTATDLRNLTTGTTGSGSLVFATSPTFATSINGSYLTASELLITDGSKNIVSAPVATYPSLTELTYLKGVTSAIQTQLNGKLSAEVDGSVTNELQTVSNTSAATTHTVTLSNSGGSFQLAEGTGISLTTTGTGLDGVVTIAESNEVAGLYTPTGGSVTNIAAIGTVYGHYYREGSMVHGTIYTTVTATTGSVLTEVSFTLPVASNFTNTYDGMGNGTVTSSANGQSFSGRLFGSVANDNLVFAYRPTSTASLEVNITFSYEIK